MYLFWAKTEMFYSIIKKMYIFILNIFFLKSSTRRPSLARLVGRPKNVTSKGSGYICLPGPSCRRLRQRFAYACRCQCAAVTVPHRTHIMTDKDRRFPFFTLIFLQNWLTSCLQYAYIDQLVTNWHSCYPIQPTTT